jgi:hypothetical protein
MDSLVTLWARDLIEQYRTCEDAAGVARVQEQILAELEESYAAARGTDDSHRNG